MNFHARLIAETTEARNAFLRIPIIQGVLQRGEVSLPSYLAFLTEAYHHVRHTVPLLAACRAALPAQHAWLHEPLSEYIEEEAGHEEWILDDIAACGADAARPPRWPLVAIDRMNTPGSPACSCIRIRSPSNAPPVKGDEGSTASTPTRRPDAR